MLLQSASTVAIYVIVVSVLIAHLQAFYVDKHKVNHVKDSILYATTSSIDTSIVIRIAENKDFQKIASFLAENMYSGSIPIGQRKELARLEFNDLSDKYSELMGRRQLPAVLLVGEETATKQLVG